MAPIVLRKYVNCGLGNDHIRLLVILLAYIAAAIGAATIRENGVTDSSSRGSNTSNISLDFPANNINHGTSN